MKIGVTGADGLLGFHLRSRLRSQPTRYEVRLANRATFADPAALQEFVTGLDAVFHCAGMNRGDDESVESTNRWLADQLVDAMRRTGSAPAVVFANSTHVARDTAYGRGKRAAGEMLEAWGREAGCRVGNIILPHVFGEFGRPFYNSVVSTFCYQLAHGDSPKINVDIDLELVHAQEVADFFLAWADGTVSSEQDNRLHMSGRRLAVSELLLRLNELLDHYARNVIPDISDALDLRLFNTLRSYMFPAHYPRTLELHTDPRGSLFEAIKTHPGGQAFVSSTHPGITRGNHFHLRKMERFLVVAGEAVIQLRKLFSDEVVSFRVSGAAPAFIDIPTFHAHSITNVGQGELCTLFWANEFFDVNNSDTYPEAVFR